MHENKRAVTKGWAGVAMALAVVVSGCGLSGSDVELNGGIFDALGVSSAANANRGGEPKLAPRAGIVLPPSENRLPAPGAAVQTGSVNPEAWPDDPDQKKVRTAAAREREQAEFCRRQEMEAKTQSSPMPKEGPLGPCGGSILGLFGTSSSSLVGGGNPK